MAANSGIGRPPHLAESDPGRPGQPGVVVSAAAQAPALDAVAVISTSATQHPRRLRAGQRPAARGCRPAQLPGRGGEQHGQASRLGKACPTTRTSGVFRARRVQLPQPGRRGDEGAHQTLAQPERVLQRVDVRVVADRIQRADGAMSRAVRGPRTAWSASSGRRTAPSAGRRRGRVRRRRGDRRGRDGRARASAGRRRTPRPLGDPFPDRERANVRRGRAAAAASYSAWRRAGPAGS